MNNTAKQIQALRADAAEHGDEEQVELCDRALAGDDVAWCACEDAIRAAMAMDD